MESSRGGEKLQPFHLIIRLVKRRFFGARAPNSVGSSWVRDRCSPRQWMHEHRTSVVGRRRSIPLSAPRSVRLGRGDASRSSEPARCPPTASWTVGDVPSTAYALGGKAPTRDVLRGSHVSRACHLDVDFVDPRPVSSQNWSEACRGGADDVCRVRSRRAMDRIPYPQFGRLVVWSLGRSPAQVQQVVRSRFGPRSNARVSGLERSIGDVRCASE